ncbi:MAG: hypothetical protein ACEPOV_09465 [Hyphomicrobiales bacterium]
MKNKNDIFDNDSSWKDYLKEYKADQGFWNVIEDSLNKESNSINWGKETDKLPLHSPDIDLWDRIENKLDSKKRRKVLLYWVNGVAAAILLLLLIPFQFTEKKSSREHFAYLKQVNHRKVLVSSKEKESKLAYHSETIKHKNKHIYDQSSTLTKVIKRKLKALNQIDIKSCDTQKQLLLTPCISEEKKLMLINEVLSTQEFTHSNAITDKEKEKDPAKWFLSSAFNTEFINNSGSQNINGNGAELCFQYNKEKSNLKFGLAFQQIDLKETYHIDYETYDFAGTRNRDETYWKVTINPDGEIEYYEQTRSVQEEVFDTISGRDISSIRNDYLFLKIPVSYGYQIINSKKWYWDVNAGINLNLMINYRRPKPSLGEDYSKIVSLKSDDYKSDNGFSYQLLLQMETGFKVGQSSWLFGAPGLRYYPSNLPINNITSSDSRLKFNFGIGLRFKL